MLDLPNPLFYLKTEVYAKKEQLFGLRKTEIKNVGIRADWVDLAMKYLHEWMHGGKV